MTGTPPANRLAMPWAFADRFPTVVSTPRETLMQTLRHFLPSANPAQLSAWRSSLDVLQDEGAAVLRLHPPAEEHSAVLEYELPRESGRRPDVLVLQNGTIAVLEFKETGRVRRADVDQVAAYARDLRAYHSESHDLDIVPILVLCGLNAPTREVDRVRIIPGYALAAALVDLARSRNGPPIDLHGWLDGEYAPLPSLVTAARLLFQRQGLPFVRRAHSLGVPATVERVMDLARGAGRDRQRVLVLLTGVPGAGKTLVGLQVAHCAGLDAHAVQRGRKGGAPATFLSGNGPLVQVLQDALRSRTFVQDMHRYIREYGLERRDRTPPEHLIVFDEAQRAWDLPKIVDFYRSRLEGRAVDLDRSEPDMLIEIADRIPEWSVVLALVGSGQEIHTGEEAGLRQWADALRRSPRAADWRVHGPPFLQREFTGLHYHRDERLNLDATLRSHAAADLHRWVELLLDEGAIRDAALLALRLRAEGFPIYLTRDLERARDYARNRFAGETDRRYGLMASSKAKNLLRHGIDPGFQATKQLKIARWFNDPPDSPGSCCQLREVVTEFHAQGLELDLPIVCWGDDFFWESGAWTLRRGGRPHRLTRDPFRIRTNAYRVLLTRGREGLVLFVPPIPSREMDATFEVLRAAGAVYAEEAAAASA